MTYVVTFCVFSFNLVYRSVIKIYQVLYGIDSSVRYPSIILVVLLTCNLSADCRLKWISLEVIPCLPKIPKNVDN